MQKASQHGTSNPKHRRLGAEVARVLHGVVQLSLPLGLGAGCGGESAGTRALFPSAPEPEAVDHLGSTNGRPADFPPSGVPERREAASGGESGDRPPREEDRL